MVAGLDVPQGVRLNPRNTFEVCEGMSIQAAINAAAAQLPAPSATNPWDILIYPGIYTEVITCSPYVNLRGIGPNNSVVIQQVDADVITLANNVELEGFVVRVTTPTLARTLIKDGGVACVANIKAVTLAITTPAALAHRLFNFTAASAIAIIGCFWNIGGTGATVAINNETAAATILLLSNDGTLAINAYQIGSTIAGNWTGGGNRWSGTCAWVTATLGTIELNGDSVVCSGPSNIAVASRVTLKNGRQQYEVYPWMLIQHAINAAALDTPAPAAGVPYTILIHPGLYLEAITGSAYVNLRAVQTGTVTIMQVDATILTLGASNFWVEGIIFDLNGPGAARSMVVEGGAPTARTGIIFDDCAFTITVPGGFAHRIMLLQAASNVTWRRCTTNITDGANPNIQIIRNDTVAATLVLEFNSLTLNTTGGFILFSSVAGTWTGRGNHWAGTCAMFNITLGTFTFDNCALLATAAWTNTGSTIMLRNCAIEAPVVAGNLATVRMKNCSYRAISRSGTGNIVDESPGLQDAPWHVERWAWFNTIVGAQIGVRGTPQDAGTGQVLLEVTENAAGQEAVETFPEIAGALGNEFTPARTPRFLGQISVDNFDLHVTMFFGLRETLGNAKPNIAAEECAGFDWDGTNFRAISSDGVTGTATNLAAPSTDVQHQLEVIVFGNVGVEFYVDGVLVATHSAAAGRPAVALDWQHLLATAGAGGASVIQVTVRNGGAQECPA